MSFDYLAGVAMLGMSFIAMGVGLVTLSSVATLRGFIQSEIATNMGAVRDALDAHDTRISSNHAALADHIEREHSEQQTQMQRV